MDVKNVFFYSDFKEDVYMGFSAGLFFISISAVCKLCRFLYGFNQVSCVWYENFIFILFKFVFFNSKYDASLFFCNTENGVVIFLVYVDGIIITGTDLVLIFQLKQYI